MKEILEQFSWWSALDIALVAAFVYYILALLKGTRSAQMLTGILVVTALFFLSSVWPLTTVHWVMDKFYSSFILILVILFQDDIRHGLSRIGMKRFSSFGGRRAQDEVVGELVGAVFALRSEGLGALLVLEREIVTDRYVDLGTRIGAAISRPLLSAIFQLSSPIHDGAVIIRRGAIAYAGCFLPLAREEAADQTWGTRHRAALGISQETDAVVIVVSEERQVVSLAIAGTFETDLDPAALTKILQEKEALPLTPS